MKKVLITGITGQLGSYLAEKFLNMKYEVYGILRRSSSFNTGRIDHIFDELNLVYGDLTDNMSIDSIIHDIKPDYIINAGAQSHVHTSFTIPYYTTQVDALGTLSVLEAVKKHCPQCKIIQLSTSELFGKVQETPQNEETPMNCQSPYSVAKIYGYHMTKLYRNAHNIFACNVICFNMESERRGETFVTKKITMALAKINHALNNDLDFKPLTLGFLDSKRDWGYCPNYADGIIKMLQHDKADDFVLATNETHSIREFIKESIQYTDIELEWFGENENEYALDKKTGKKIIGIDPKYYRPAEVEILLGDATKAKEILGWEPKVKFKQLVEIMMKFDMKEYN